jgi:uncharacterized RDD family membrane protein YckC
MITQQLLDYIHAQQAAGKNTDEIRAALKLAGWQDEHIEEGLRAQASGQASILTAQGTVSQYAGFWKRFAAYFIDCILIYAVFFLTLFVIGGVGTYLRESEEAAGILVTLLLLVGVWLYYALFESSHHQATLGKMALGIKVTTMDGQRISFGQASARFWCKIISGLILNIGYIMAAFTEKKQGLHDIIAKTLVVK